MEMITHVLLLISGLFSLSSCVLQHEYHLFTRQKNWSGAQSFCRERCTDLATMDDLGEMKAALAVVEGRYDDAIWIGLRKGEISRWHWSLSDDDFYQEGERNYINKDTSGSNCAYQRNGWIHQDNCGTGLYALCFDESRAGSEQYVLSAVKKNWTEARNYCRTYHTDLVSVRNSVEQQTIRNVAGTRNAWIGLFKDTWEWSDQSESSLRYWKEDVVVHAKYMDPCVAMLKRESGKWGPRLCEETHPFLCKCPISRRVDMSISLRISPLLEQNAPAPLDDIANHIKQELMKQGVNGITLQWKKQPNGKFSIKNIARPANTSVISCV